METTENRYEYDSFPVLEVLIGAFNFVLFMLLTLFGLLQFDTDKYGLTFIIEYPFIFNDKSQEVKYLSQSCSKFKILDTERIATYK